MTNKLQELGRQQTAVCGKKTEVYTNYRNLASGILNKYLADFSMVDTTRCTISCYASGKTEIYFTIAFRTDNGYDFGSDFTVEYEEVYNRLFINYGTIGRFTCDDIYQCERIRVLNAIVENRLAIEMELDALCKEMGELIDLQNQAWEIESEIQSIKKQIAMMEFDAIDKHISEGTVYKYAENSGYRYHHLLPANGRWFSIVKVTPKKVRLHIYGDYVDNTYLVDRQQFVCQVKNQVIEEVTA